MCLITSHSHRPSASTQFDTDSAPVGIDNRCSVCMSHLKSDFVGDLTETTLAVTGFHGTKPLQVFKGTMLWHIEDDAGIVHEVKIPNSYHVPKGNHRLLRPQHWAQQANGASCLTLNDRAILKWNEGKAVRTVPIDAQNVFTFDTAPGYRRFAVACMQANYIPSVHDHTPDTVQSTKDSQRGLMQMQEHVFDYLPEMEELEHNSNPSPINLNGVNKTQNDQHITRATLDKQRREPTAELLRMHYKFGHVSFSRLRAMARNGCLPTYLEECPLPVCPSCLYGKAKRRSTQTKAKRSINPTKAIRESGDCVSVDVLVSKTPG
jgi:hypothetical protein